MANVTLNVGATWELDQLQRIAILNRQYPTTQVTEVYGSMGDYGTARSRDRIPGWDEGKLRGYVKLAQEIDVVLKWTLNFSCFGASGELDWSKYQDLLLYLWELGVRQYIVALPLVLRLVKETLPTATVEISTIARITSVRMLEEYLEMGAAGVCWDVMENRNFPLLEACVELAQRRGAWIEMIANELCTPMCIYRNHCYTLSSHNSERTHFTGYPFAWCIEERKKSPWKWLASGFILPEHLNTYAKQGVTRFKITGRTWPTRVVMRILRFYMERKSPYNLLELWPHVNPLVGNRENPVEDLYIPTTFLALGNFLERFRGCHTRCGVNCSSCRHLYKKIAHVY